MNVTVGKKTKRINVKNRNKMTGEEVGRIILQDMVLVVSGEAQGFSMEEKIAMVNALETPEDIATYNDYKALIDYLSKVPVLCQAYYFTARASFTRVIDIIRRLLEAEQENMRLFFQPKVMTVEEYKVLKEHGYDFSQHACGVALIMPGSNAAPSLPATPMWYTHYLAEAILERKENIKAEIDIVEEYLRQLYAVKEGVLLLAEYVGMPEVMKLFKELFRQEELDITGLNKAMREAPRSIRRYGQPDIEKQLRGEIRELLTPIKIKTLKPSAESIDKARGLINMAIVKGSMWQVYETLLGGDGT